MPPGRLFKPFLLLLAAVLVCGPAHGAASKKSAGQPIAIWQLRSLGLDAARTEAIRRAIAGAFQRSPDWRLVSDKTIQVRLRKADLDVRSPLDKVAPALAARYLVTGTLAGLGDQISLDFKLLDGQTGREIRRVALEVPEQPEQIDGLAEVLDELVVRLLNPERWVGSLELEVSEPGARVWLDGSEVATSPLAEPLGNLAPGKHILMIRKEGFGEFTKFVFVRYDQVARLNVDLASASVAGLLYERRDVEPEPPPAPPPTPVVSSQPAPDPGLNWQQIVGFTGLALGVAAGAAGGLLGLHSEQLEGQVERGWWTIDNLDRLRAIEQAGVRYSRWANRMFVVAGALALVSAGMLVWGYLDDDRDAPASAEPVVTTAFELAPLPGGLGLGLRARF